MTNFISSLVRVGEKARLNRFLSAAKSINSDLVPALGKDTDDELRTRAAKLAKQLSSDHSLVDDPATVRDVFALCSEAAFRVLSQRPYDVQLAGGLALAHGMIAEMATGEGKTLTSIAPTVLHALTGRGVHVVTVNDYLARRDAEWMGRVYQFLGLSVGVITTDSTPQARREAYSKDITYVTSTELGFDYLRDNMVLDLSERVRRGEPDSHVFALVDEADSILVDEARTPLIISGAGDDTSIFGLFASIANSAVENEDYVVERYSKQVVLKEGIVATAESMLGLGSKGKFRELFTDRNSNFVTYLSNAVKAKELFIKNEDYIIESGEVLIVDPFTGRAMPGRRYSDGLHQAIEAKEKVTVLPDDRTIATTTLQSFLRQYERLSGMTGTAQTEAVELRDTYGIEVLQIPTNKPVVRDDRPSLVYATADKKWKAVVDQVREITATGRPVLVGTTTVEDSQHVSQLLKKNKITHRVLNAKLHVQEAEIVAEAGRLSAVTVATNMAGRGTDIVLGGNPDAILTARLAQRGLDPLDPESGYQEAWDEEYPVLVEETAAAAEKITEIGGLAVIGTELHDSVRIDNQLRGRCGRQGDPGSSQFLLSLDDRLLAKATNEGTAETIRKVASSHVDETGLVNVPGIAQRFSDVQSEVASRDRQSRRDVAEYDEVLDNQRREVYSQRDKMLETSWSWMLGGLILEAVESTLIEHGIVRGKKIVTDCPGFEAGVEAVARVLGTTSDAVREKIIGSKHSEAVVIDLSRLAKPQIVGATLRANALVEDGFDTAVRNSGVLTLDRYWQSHLETMSILRDGIGLRSIAQMNPKVEYNREAFEAFDRMALNVRRDIVATVLGGAVESPREFADLVTNRGHKETVPKNRAQRRREQRRRRKMGEA